MHLEILKLQILVLLIFTVWRPLKIVAFFALQPNLKMGLGDVLGGRGGKAPKYEQNAETPHLKWHSIWQAALDFLPISSNGMIKSHLYVQFLLNRFTLPDSKGGQCDVLAYSPKHSLRSTWKTIASPRFSIFERDRGCDDLNSLNLEQEEPRGRILTGKHPVVNIMVQDTLLPEGFYEVEDEENVRLLNTQSVAARPKLLVCR